MDVSCTVCDGFLAAGWVSFFLLLLAAFQVCVEFGTALLLCVSSVGMLDSFN